MEKRNKQYQIMKCKNESGGERGDMLQEIEIYMTFHKKEKAEKSRSVRQKKLKNIMRRYLPMDPGLLNSIISSLSSSTSFPSPLIGE